MSYKENVLLELRKQSFYDCDVIKKLKEAVTDDQITWILLKNNLLGIFVEALDKDDNVIQEHLNVFWKQTYERLYEEALYKCNVFIDLYIRYSVKRMKIYNEEILFDLLTLIAESIMEEAKITKDEHIRMLDEINELSSK